MSYAYTLTVAFKDHPADKKKLLDGLVAGLESAGLAADLTDSAGDHYSSKPADKPTGTVRELSRSGFGLSDTAVGEQAFREGDEWRRAELRRRGIEPAQSEATIQAEVDRNLAMTGLGQRALEGRAAGRVA